MSVLPPRFISTRGAGYARPFQDALLQGLAPDGGLFIPDQIPPIAPSALEQGLALPERAFLALRPWIGDAVDDVALQAILLDALDFPVPLVPLHGDGWEGLFVLELFHGPTLSFKDFGARTMARLMHHYLEKRGDRLTILVATSGDTGSAVASGFAGQGLIDVVLLYPEGQVSPTQERQLIVKRPGVRSFAVQGTFDDCQRMVKEAFLDSSLATLRLSSANSINIGRLLPQMLYYLHAGSKVHQPVFCVPSGNLGNLTAGVMAHLSGLPVRRFLAAHNANDFFPRYLTGENEALRPSHRTLSNAMDVGVPSNFERLRTLLTLEEMRALIWGTSVDDADTLETMQTVYHETGYMADPHTAVGLRAARRFQAETGDLSPVIVLSTAHPAKFSETVLHAIGVTPLMPPALAALLDQATQVESIAPTLQALKDQLLADA